jgi:hypothetical protein
MKFAYADPPYIGQAKKHYRDHQDYAGEVDHAELIRRLERDYDGWALSCSSPTLGYLLSLCTTKVRVGAWVKPWAAQLNTVRVGYVWEPVIFAGGRWRPSEFDQRVYDWIMAPPVISNHNGTRGSKPQAFCYWLFTMLGVTTADEFDDLFPGSGAVTQHLEAWLRQTRLAV